MSTHEATDQTNPIPTRTITLSKRDQKFLFRYDVGEELKLLDSLIEMVKRSDMPFDWFDAAVVAHQLGDPIAQELKGHFPSQAQVSGREED
jgi:hypothetical protein